MSATSPLNPRAEAGLAACRHHGRRHLNFNSTSFEGLIARKVSCGNKTEAGIRNFQVLRSVAPSCWKHGHDVVFYLASLLPISARADPVPTAVE